MRRIRAAEIGRVDRHALLPAGSAGDIARSGSASPEGGRGGGADGGVQPTRCAKAPFSLALQKPASPAGPCGRRAWHGRGPRPARPRPGQSRPARRRWPSRRDHRCADAPRPSGSRDFSSTSPARARPVPSFQSRPDHRPAAARDLMQPVVTGWALSTRVAREGLILPGRTASRARVDSMPIALSAPPAAWSGTTNPAQIPQKKASHSAAPEEAERVIAQLSDDLAE